MLYLANTCLGIVYMSPVPVSERMGSLPGSVLGLFVKEVRFRPRDGAPHYSPAPLPTPQICMPKAEGMCTVVSMNVAARLVDESGSFGGS